MSKTRKRVLSALAILFALALVFTACLALTGCGETEDDGTTDTSTSEGTGNTGNTETTWPEEWTIYIFDGTKTGTEDAKFGVYVEGWFAVGTQSQVESYVGTANGATTGYWGYIDGELVFVRGVGSLTGTDYYICEMTTNTDGSVTISDSHGTSAISGTITDIGCLVGNGYDFTGFEIVTE